MNIVEPILFQAKLQPKAPALYAQGIDVVSYARLAAQMSNVARRAISSGLRRGNVVGLSVDEPLLHAAVILGLTQAGIVPVSVAVQRPPSGLKIDAAIRNGAYPFLPQVPHLPLDYSWLMGEGVAEEVSPAGGIASDQVCRIILTSGTTGDPKAVALTHRQIMARNARFEYLLGNRHPTFSRIYIHMGIAAALSYYFLTYILGCGGTVFFRGETLDTRCARSISSASRRCWRRRRRSRSCWRLATGFPRSTFTSTPSSPAAAC